MSNQSYRSAPDSAPAPGGYLALVLAWVVPGLGHLMLGEKARGIVFGITIHGLFALGMLIAGLRAINPPEQAIWTYTQFLAGWPMLVASYYEKSIFEPVYVKRDATGRTAIEEEYEARDARPPSSLDQKSQARIDSAKELISERPLFAYHPKIQDVGAVYCGIAGMLNLLVVFDVLLRITGSERELPEDKSTRAQAATPRASATPQGAGPQAPNPGGNA